MSIKRVLKAPTTPVTDFASLQPFLDAGGLYVSDKEDGIRCVTHPELGPVSQKMLSIPNLWVQTMLLQHCSDFLDGELVAIDCEGNDASFNDTQSAIMSVDGQPRFEFRVFDCFENIYLPYTERLIRAKELVREATDLCVAVLCQQLCRTIKGITRCEEAALENGKEGIMLRQPGGWYKEGRSTFNEGYLLKVKRFTDDEALVIGVEEEMENCNVATTDAGGLQKRSKHASGLKGKGMVGKLICKWKGKTIKIGSGMTVCDKDYWWQRPKEIIGKTITFKYQAHGMKDLPRAPIFKGIRHDI